MGKLIVARHGITEYNQKKMFCGTTDVSISEEGMVQAEKVGGILGEHGIQLDRVYLSWLKRSWETNAIILETLGQLNPIITKHPFLNERHYGDLQGHTHAEAIEKYGQEHFQEWRRSYNVRPPNGECLADVAVRAGFYLTSEILPHVIGGETVMVCAHGNTNRSIIKLMEKISDEEIIKTEIAYDTPVIYEVSSLEEIKRVL